MGIKSTYFKLCGFILIIMITGCASQQKFKEFKANTDNRLNSLNYNFQTVKSEISLIDGRLKKHESQTIAAINQIRYYIKNLKEAKDDLFALLNALKEENLVEMSKKHELLVDSIEKVRLEIIRIKKILKLP